MPFPYYDRLSSRDKAIYRRSDEVGKVALPAPEAARPLVEDLRRALAAEDRASIEAAAGGLALALAQQLELPPVGLSVLAVRPSSGGCTASTRATKGGHRGSSSGCEPPVTGASWRSGPS
jgi:hypothetical protein